MAHDRRKRKVFSPRSMRFGFNIPLADVFSDLALVAEVAREIEANGWDGCFVWDHLSIPGTARLADPWIALALIARATKRIRIGPIVTPLFRRHPEKLAYETVTLDHLSHGRLILGIGLGSDIFNEITAFGGPTDDRMRAEMLDEGLAVLNGLWSGESFSFDGKYYRFNGARITPGCLQKPRIPTWIAASWRRKPPMRRAAAYDGVVPVRGDLLHSLSTDQIKEMLAYIDFFRPPNAPFDVIHFGQTAGFSLSDARALVASYSAAGVTWWVETVSPGAQLDQTLRTIRGGPPR
jgi:alkanesulfonate monooxygenase SsuD/methylene tetrahydromethanopterin reductase-like flavin-dependent oxidoreductase (luciferase family)